MKHYAGIDASLNSSSVCVLDESEKIASDGENLLMGWSGRAPARQQVMLARGAKDKEHAMSQKLNTAIAVIGIDSGKNSFHVVGHDERGAIMLRQKWSRG